MIDPVRLEETKKSEELLDAVGVLLLDRDEPHLRALMVFLKMVCEIADKLGIRKEDLYYFINEYKPVDLKIKENQN